MKKIRIIVMFCILFAIPNIVSAACPATELNDLKKIASNITYKYEYIEKFDESGYGEVEFTITLANIFNGLMVKYTQDSSEIILNRDNFETRLITDKYGISHKFDIYADGSTSCSGEKLNTIYVKLPNYNKYYVNDLCEKAPEHNYCQKWSNVKVDEKTFQKTLEKYIKDKNNKGNDLSKEDEYEKIYALLEFLNKYVYIVAIPIILLCIVGIIYLNNKNNFNLKV